MPGLSILVRCSTTHESAVCPKVEVADGALWQSNVSFRNLSEVCCSPKSLSIMNRRKRLKKRFVAHDAELNRWLGVFAIVILTVGTLIHTIPESLDYSKNIKTILTWSYASCVIPAYVVFYYCVSRKIGTKHGLLCLNCGKTLRKLSFRHRTQDPDYSLDGEIPKRCPHCRIDVADVTRRSKGESRNPP